jgi:PucR C-terminal helix-turn-helix domain
MRRRATLPAIRPDVLESLVHPIPGNRVGGDVQLVVRVSVGTDDDSSAVEHPVEAVLAEVSPLPKRPAAAADLVGFCAELTRAVGNDDLPGAITLIAIVADCPAALLRADRSVLTVGEPRRAARNGSSWRWAANGPQCDREIAIESATHRLGVLTFQRPVPDPTEPIWRIVHDLLAMALLGRNATKRAEAAELQAALFACLSDENRSDPGATGTSQVAYRPAVLSPVDGLAWPPDALARLRARIGEETLLTEGRMARIEDRVVCLYPQQADALPRAHAEAWQRLLAAISPLRCQVAIGTPDLCGSGLQQSYRTARWLADLQAAPTAGLRVEDVAVVDELGVVASALGPGWGPRLGHFVRRVLGDVLDNPRFGGAMVDTLHAYLIRGSSPTEAARLLHLSPSSMKYRMRIIRETLGDRLDDHDSAFEIELALRLLKALDAGATGSGSGVVTPRTHGR